MPGPNDKTVTVGFDPATQRFTFSDPSVTMTTSGNIVLVKDDPSNKAWDLYNVIVDSDPTQFPITSKSGTQIVIDDKHTANGTYSYRVQVTAGSSTYTSPDPQIVNSNPG